MRRTLFDTARPTRWGYRDIGPAIAYEHRRRVRIVDVREPHEYAAGHIPGAELVPVALVGERLRGWDSQADLILVCRSGVRSGNTAEALVSAGFHRVMNLAGGMIAYAAAGLPIDERGGPGEGRAAAAPVEYVPTRL